MAKPIDMFLGQLGHSDLGGSFAISILSDFEDVSVPRLGLFNGVDPNCHAKMREQIERIRKALGLREEPLRLVSSRPNGSSPNSIRYHFFKRNRYVDYRLQHHLNPLDETTCILWSVMTRGGTLLISDRKVWESFRGGAHGGGAICY